VAVGNENGQQKGEKILITKLLYVGENWMLQTVYHI
jgi:hypothetical protein